MTPQNFKKWRTLALTVGLSITTGALVAAVGEQEAAKLGKEMRGHVYRSQDQGLSWTATVSGTQQSLTAIHERQDASVLITGTGGVLLQRTGADPAFKRHTRADNASLTGVVSHASGDVFVSTAGILRND